MSEQENRDCLERLLAATADHLGTAYFRALVKAIVETIPVDFACVGEILPGTRRIRTRAAFERGEWVADIEYDLEGTPCAEVTAGQYCVYEENVAELFPDDALLAEQGYNSYAGYALSSSKGEVIGLLVVLDHKPLTRSDTVFAALRFLAARAAAELERLRTERATRHALIALDQASRVKDDFLNTISHELRTPLNAVIGFSDVLKTQTLDEERRQEYAGYIHDAGTDLLASLNAILELTRARSGDARFRPDDVDVAEVVEEAIANARSKANAHGAEVESRCPPDVVIAADRRMLRQMLTHLLDNAIAYGAEKGRIQVDCTMSETGGDCRVSVHDDGPGMSGEEVAEALQPFGRPGDAHSRQVSGLGLGLPLVAAFMKLHGGRLEIESSPGMGTCATLVFPPPARVDTRLVSDLIAQATSRA